MQDESEGILYKSTSFTFLNTPILPVILLNEGKSIRQSIVSALLFITSLLLAASSPINAFLPRVMVCRTGKSTASITFVCYHFRMLLF